MLSKVIVFTTVFAKAVSLISAWFPGSLRAHPQPTSWQDGVGSRQILREAHCRRKSFQYSDIILLLDDRLQAWFDHNQNPDHVIDQVSQHCHEARQHEILT